MREEKTMTTDGKARGGKKPGSNERDDRRELQRAPLGRLTAFFGEARFGSARVVDLSERGVCLQGAGLPESGEVQLSIPLPDRHGKVRRCRAVARVVAHEGERVRFAMRPLRPVHMLQLRDYVWRRSA
jgi:hypothetical protein